jgi:ribose 5-phosphate isomerase A
LGKHVTAGEAAGKAAGMNADNLKRKAAHRALSYVESGMRLGLGTGSTAAAFVDALGRKVAEGLDVVCVPTSEATRIQAEGLGIRLATLDEVPQLDVTVDGADEIDGQLRLIKGGGGAHLREKIVATASDRMIVIADDSKLVETLGRFPLPVEIVSFGLRATHRLVEALSAEAGCAGEIVLRERGGAPVVTDNGNYILDCAFGRIPEPEILAYALMRVPGVVEHGLFIGVCDLAILAGEGGLRELRAE